MKIYLHKNDSPIHLRDIEASFFSGTIVEEPINFSEEIKSGSHIVNIGDFGLTNFSLIAKNEFNFEDIELVNILRDVLKNNEVMSLYPKYKWTILPYSYRTSSGFGVETKEIKKFIDDAFQKELTLIKSGKLIFDFRDIGFEGNRYNNMVSYLANTKYPDVDLSVHIISTNNKEFISESELNSFPIGKYNLPESSEKEMIRTPAEEAEDLYRKENMKYSIYIPIFFGFIAIFFLVNLIDSFFLIFCLVPFCMSILSTFISSTRVSNTSTYSFRNALISFSILFFLGILVSIIIDTISHPEHFIMSFYVLPFLFFPMLIALFFIFIGLSTAYSIKTSIGYLIKKLFGTKV